MNLITIHEKKPTLWQVFLSVIAAIFGVQSTQNRERDFQYGSPAAFITVGIIVVVALVIGIMLLVKLITAS